jgi:hypothetical protein
MFVKERYASHKKQENTLRSYLDLLNQVVLKNKKPFSEMMYDDFISLLMEWQANYGEATMHGRKCKLKAFFRWESGDKHDLRVEKIRSGGYVSPVTIHDLLTDDEIVKLRKADFFDPYY